MTDPAPAAALLARIAAAAAAYPQATEDAPWGHQVFKVRGKVFVFLPGAQGTTNVTFKLPAGREFALAWPGASPTGYGLGRSGWVTVDLAQAGAIDPDLLLAWLDESYRAVAPRRLCATLPPRDPA